MINIGKSLFEVAEMQLRHERKGKKYTMLEVFDMAVFMAKRIHKFKLNLT